MRITFIAFLFSVFYFAANADEPTVTSPNKRYIIRLHRKPDSIYPLIILRDRRTGHDDEIFDYDSVGQATTGLKALWSPDSRYVALTIAVGPSTQEVALYRIDSGKAREVKILPIPKALDTKKYSFRGGTYTDRWEDNRTLWIGDSSKNRRFRFHLTKDGKLLADTFKDDEPN